MNKRRNQKSRLEHDRSKRPGETHCPTEVTRREFVQYSTFALVAAALSLSLPGCGGGGGDAEGNVDETEPLTFDQTSPKISAIKQRNGFTGILTVSRNATSWYKQYRVKPRHTPPFASLIAS